MSVNDYGIEVLRKASESLTGDSKAEYVLRNRLYDADGNDVTGQNQPTGLKIAIKTTTVTITDTATPLPLTAQVGRNSLEIHNKSLTNTLFVGNADVTADSEAGTTSGKEIPPNSFWSIDITSDIILYGRCESGKSTLIKITEVS